MPTNPNLHLRGFRKRSCLTQNDLARLLGHVSASTVSRLETGEQSPDLRTAFMLEAIFDASASRILRELFAGCAKAVRDRAELLDDGLTLQPDAPDVRRRRLELDAIIARIDRLRA